MLRSGEGSRGESFLGRRGRGARRSWPSRVSPWPEWGAGEGACCLCPSSPAPGAPGHGANRESAGSRAGFLRHQFLMACRAHLAPILPEDFPRAEVLVTALARGVVAEPDRSVRAPPHLPADGVDYPGLTEPACQPGRGVACCSLTLVPRAR